MASAESEPLVSVQGRQRVGDLDATILRASDAASLARWLRAHKYPATPELTEWLAPYIKRGWSITAFRIATDFSSKSSRELALRGTWEELRLQSLQSEIKWQETRRDKDHQGELVKLRRQYAALLASVYAQLHGVALQPVQLTFSTDAPFYPYREGTGAVTNPSRSLTVYYFGDKRVQGTLQNEASAAEPSGTVASQSHSVTVAERGAIAESLGLNVKDIGERMTLFVDRSALRKRADLYFAPSPDQSAFQPTQEVIQYVYILPGSAAIIRAIFGDPLQDMLYVALAISCYALVRVRRTAKTVSPVTF